MHLVVDNEVKRLANCYKKDIDLKNRARRLAGLDPIIIKVRKCMRCGCKFESAESRFCGCNYSDEAGFISGREII